MTILLDIDGVLVTTPPWKAVELHEDGFMRFNEVATRNLAYLIDQTKAAIVLTSTHRISYSLEDWKSILYRRGIYPSVITKVNQAESLSDMANRVTEILGWLEAQLNPEPYIIIDDDLSLNALPERIKARCVLTKPMIGIDQAAVDQAMRIWKNTN